MKKFFTLLCVAFCATALFANVVTGTCGDNLQWAYDTDTHALTITGSGDMYYWIGERPWEQVAGEITSVSLPDGVTSIGKGAFRYCSSLTSITIPNSVTSIGDWALAWCSGLTSITIPNSVTSIGVGAFQGCSGLTSVTLGNSVTSIGNSAFSGCLFTRENFINNSSLNEEENDFWGAEIVDLEQDGLFIRNDTVIDCKPTVTSVSIPDYITCIGDWALAWCSGLTSITIPNSVTSIGGSAFYGCSGLTSITIPNSVTSIGNSAFSNCSSLTSIVVEEGNTMYDSREKCNAIIETASNTLVVGCKNTTIPNSVTSIGDEAFASCDGLTSITIPNSVTSIGVHAFSDCSGLTSPVYNAHCFAYMPTSFEGAYNIPDGIKQIAGGAFAWCSSLTSITIPNSVTSIGKKAFSDCSGLTSVTIPNSVTSIGDEAFYYCSGLTSITIPNSVTSIGYSAFQGCSGLTSITIPNSVTSIGVHAFQYCSGLTSVTIPNSVTSIGSYAFCRCESLTSITIPNSVTSIGNSAFSGCSGLTSVVWNAENCADFSSSSAPFDALSSQITSFTFGDSVKHIPARLCYGMKNLTSITIPNSVTSIGKLAFDRCSALTSITIPESVTTIGNNAFEYCTNLTSIVWNPVSCSGFWTEETTYCIFYGCENVTSVAFGNKVAEIPRYLCWKMPKLTSITIPESVKTIEEYAFSYCYSLDSIIIPDNVTDVKRGAFYDCSHLKSVTIGNGVKTIGDYAFYDCVALQNAILGNRITTIGKSAFYKCSSLTSLTIPNSVTSIGSNAFDDCFFTKNNFINNSSLDEVVNKYWGATIADIEQDGLLISNDTVVGCRPMVTSVVIPNTITCIGDYAFRDCSSLTSVTIPNSVTSIGISAFNGCSSLNSITIPNSVINIGRLAFEGTGIYNDESNWENDVLYIDNCLIQARETITGTYNIKENTRMIGGGAFWFCTSLESIIIPESVTNIGEYAFVGCESITSIDLPNRITSIGRSTFSQCSSLTSVTIPNSVTSIGRSAFSDCTSLSSITIPNSVTSIGEMAFCDCTSLTSITIPNSVTSIGDWAFQRDSSLLSITIPKSVISIGERAFINCISLTTLVVEPDNTIYDSRDNCNAIIETATNTLVAGCQNTIIPSDIKSLGSGAFQGCTSLTSITIPNSVTSIGRTAFYNCSSLDTIYVEATTPPTIESNTFTNTPASICYIPCGTKSVYKASAWAQYMGEFVEHAVELTSGICGENLYWEYADTKLIISGAGAMYDNIVECLPWAWLLDSIRSIEMSEGITHIAAYAFDGCSALRELHLPASVLAIGEYAFGNTPRLYEITCLAPEPPVADASSFTNYDAYLHAYCDAQRYYSIDPVWKNFHNVECIVTENEVTGDVTIIPSDYEATVVWLSHADAAAYALVITKNDVTFCTLKFNKYGQLTNIAFAPSRTHHNKQQAAEATPTGYSFTITGLDENTTYGYAFSVLNEESAVIEEFVGEFTTQSNASTAVDNVDASTCGTQKLLRNGQLLILRDGKTYTIMGQEL